MRNGKIVARIFNYLLLVKKEHKKLGFLATAEERNGKIEILPSFRLTDTPK